MITILRVYRASTSVYGVFCSHSCIFSYTQLGFTVNLTAGPWWRPLPEQPVNCTISLDIIPPSPVPVESIELLQDLPLPFEITYNNQRVLDRFNLSWSPPLEPRGDIQQYVVFVGSSLKEGTDTFGFETVTVGLFALNTNLHL